MTARVSLVVAALVCALVGAGGCAGDCAPAGAPGGQTLGFMAQYAADVCLGPAGATGLAVAVTTVNGNLGLGAAGLSSEADDAAMDPRTPVRLGPVGELFTAALVLRLVDAGRTGLDAVLADRVTEAITDEPVTLAHLLGHRSGLVDYSGLSAVDLGAEAAPLTLLTAATQRPLRFSPGARHQESPTNALALGLFVERLLGVPWGQALHEGVLDPFGLSSTAVLGFDPAPDGLAAGHDARGVDVSGAVHAMSGYAAFGVVSTTTDVERLVRLLFEDPDFLSDERRRALRIAVDGVAGDLGFGLGAEIFEVDGVEAWGRRGVHPAGSAAAVTYLPEAGAAGVALLTGRPGRAAWAADLAAGFGAEATD